MPNGAPLDVTLGDVVFVDVTATNTGTLNGTAKIYVAFLSASGNTTINLINLSTGLLDGQMILDPGQTETQTWSVTIVGGLGELGHYSTVVGAYDLLGVALVEITEPDQINIYGQFSLEITDIFEYI